MIVTQNFASKKEVISFITFKKKNIKENNNNNKSQNPPFSLQENKIGL